MQSDLRHQLAHVEGSAFTLAKRALASLPAPSLLRDMQDQTRKAIFESSQLIFKVGEVGQGLAKQLAFPKLDGFTARVPGLDTEQAVGLAGDYVKKGLRDFESAAGAVFGELRDQLGSEAKKAVASAAQAAGVVQAQEKIQELSREFGAVADQVKNQFSKARKEAEDYAAGLKKNAV